MSDGRDRARAGDPRADVVVGILADPETAPVDVARQLADDLPGALRTTIGDDRTWSAEIVEERLPLAGDDHAGLVQAATAQMRNRGWTYAVCVTDLPLRDGQRPSSATCSASLASPLSHLPAFGAMRRRRVQAVLRNLVAELIDRPLDGQTPPGAGLPRLPGALRRTEPTAAPADVRVVASRSRARLLIGMVRDNRPWRLVLGLTGALAAAAAFSAFWTINPMVWQLSAALGPVSLSIAMVAAITAMVVWLIVAHHLWEGTASDEQREHDEVVLFNASTVLTLAIGIGCMYVGLLVMNLVATQLIVAGDIFAEYVRHPPTIVDHAELAWMATSAATVAGALGTGFESEQAVRDAAYSYRERERRRQRAGHRRVPAATDTDTRN